MTLIELFNILDLNEDGELSRSDLHESARRMGWHFREAPVFAVLDLLTLEKPISRDRFIAYMTQISEDPHGPFGKVLLNAPHYSPSVIAQKPDVPDTLEIKKEKFGPTSVKKAENDLAALLKKIAGEDAAESYERLLTKTDLDKREVPMEDAALLVIDPQRSFTRGVWMKSIGFAAETEVMPLRLAFEKCAKLLTENIGVINAMFTRCPFPPESYDWDDAFDETIDRKQLYFIKPGNSVLFPSTNGFREWVERIIHNGKNILVMAGCTLNSCVRVSSIETQNYFKKHKLQVVVDLNLSGARTSRFKPSSLYEGVSAVESAVREMMGSGVRVVDRVHWV
ncbi:MAG: hypothetical protein JRI75_01640 [Deltaproteobacteria bacterium]|nr:hypothetical protein [Deltaproteobacteria bacterium]